MHLACSSTSTQSSLLSSPFNTCTHSNLLSRPERMGWCLNGALARVTTSSALLALSVVFFTYAAIFCSAGTPVSNLLTPPPNYGNSSDRMALLAFRSSIVGDPKGALSSWNDSSHFCHWQGITCGRRHPERVVQLSLRSCGLSGPVHASVVNLTFLRRLDLSDNNFYGHIPRALCHNLRRIHYLNLSENPLKSEIPVNFGHCINIQEIHMSGSSLRGPIPPSLGNLSHLWYLDLSYNHISGRIPHQLGGVNTLNYLYLDQNNLRGNIPPSLVNLTALSELNLSDNFLEGDIPPSLEKLRSKLTRLHLEDNKLTGTVPASLYNLSSIVSMDLAGNNLSGHLPSDLGSVLSHIEFFSLSENQFRGPIPHSIGNASSLTVFQIQSNAFSGTIPPALGTLKNLDFVQLSDNQLSTEEDDSWNFIASLANCTSLKTLDLSSNMLQGVLPHSISNMSKRLETFLLYNNYIFGSIPEGIGDLAGLTWLDFSYNYFGGTIPTTIGRLQAVSKLELEFNELRGKIPSSICNLTGLSFLNLTGNHLKGAIPNCFGSLQNLQELHILDNNLHGIIPEGLTNISRLVVLELARNSLSGSLPMEVGHLKNLNRIDISDNNFLGEIPSTLGDCQDLEFLNASGNDFRGVIPSSFRGLRAIQILDISRNNLSGNIPRFFQDFVHLKYLNLSFNNLDGEVPKQGLFSNVSAFFISGNPKLCGGLSKLHLLPCLEKKKSSRHQIKVLIATIASPIVALCMIIVLLSVVIKLGLKMKSHPLMMRSKRMLPRVTYSELNHATEGFSQHNLIGVGNFAHVYRGKLEYAGLGSKVVAVKVIKLQQHGASNSFLRECEVLRNIRHRNLIKIWTSCSSIDFQGNDFKALVFDFMLNGSLEQRLHPAIEDDRNVEKYLNLVQRVNIAMDVAFATDYLHNHQKSKPIVHRDLKPSNVLLDEDMIAHVSDFGISTFLHSNEKGDRKNTSSSSTFKGSIGYAAPEYAMGWNASMRGDVYSYGILLLEMMTGRRPTDVLFAGDLNLHKFVEAAFPDRVSDVVDPCLLREPGTRENDVESGTTNNDVHDFGASTGESTVVSRRSYLLGKTRLACMASLLRLGLACSKESPQQRLTMDAVAREVTAIKQDFLSVPGIHEQEGAWRRS